MSSPKSRDSGGGAPTGTTAQLLVENRLIHALTLDSDEEIWHGPHRNSNTPIMVPPRNVYRGSSTAYYFDPCIQVAPSTNLGNNNKKTSVTG